MMGKGLGPCKGWHCERESKAQEWGIWKVVEWATRQVAARAHSMGQKWMCRSAGRGGLGPGVGSPEGKVGAGVEESVRGLVGERVGNEEGTGVGIQDSTA